MKTHTHPLPTWLLHQPMRNTSWGDFEERYERPMCMATLWLAYKQMQTNYTIATGRKLPDVFNKQIYGVS